MKVVSKAAGVNTEDVISHELFIYNRQTPSVWGASGEYISSPRLDNLACAFCSTQALTEAKASKAVQVMYVADNEEVGSSTKQGAGSTFLLDVLSRVCDDFGSDIRISAANSMMLSADNAHAVHPNKPSLADPTHRPVMGDGVVMKYNASQLYTTDGVSSAVLREICRKADLPLQVFANRSDIRGGSTLGNIQISSVPLLSVDIGIPQLAMHSSYETCAPSDVEAMVKVIKAFFESSLVMRDGDVTINCGGSK